MVPYPGRLYPVGRLDVDSEGLILLTNDGELADHLTHPKYGHLKEYRVLLARKPDHDQLEAFRHGVVMPDGYRTTPAEVILEDVEGKVAWVNITLREGRKRQIRETFIQIGLPVLRIIRVRISTLRLGKLKPGEWRHLTPGEVAALKTTVEGQPEPKKRRTLRSNAIVQARNSQSNTNPHRDPFSSRKGKTKPTSKKTQVD